MTTGADSWKVLVEECLENLGKDGRVVLMGLVEIMADAKKAPQPAVLICGDALDKVQLACATVSALYGALEEEKKCQKQTSIRRLP